MVLGMSSRAGIPASFPDPLDRYLGRCPAVESLNVFPPLTDTAIAGLKPLAGKLKRPLLLVHGTDDQYFTPAHAIALHRASGAEMWIERGMGHGETATRGRQRDALLDALRPSLRGRPHLRVRRVHARMRSGERLPRALGTRVMQRASRRRQARVWPRPACHGLRGRVQRR